MIFRFGKDQLDIDILQTKRFYEQAGKITDGCACGGCRNFERASAFFPEAVKVFFETIGVELNKAAEIFAYYAEDDGRSLTYGGFYHLCGKRLPGQPSGGTERPELSARDAVEWHPITEDHAVHFTDEISLLEAGFPRPVLQMEILFHHVPWCLEEQNPYR